MDSLHSSLHHPAQRAWSEPHLHPSQLMYPLFVTLRAEDKPIRGLEPELQWGQGADGSFASLVAHLRALMAKGLTSVMLFGVVEDKDARGSMAESDGTPVIKCTRALRKALPELLVACDVCMCEYTDHGHCGILRDVDGEQVLDNARTLERLSAIALAYAQAGAHMVCPSDMMDNRIGAIRKTFNENGFEHVSIMAYTSKKASVMYAPFRDAVESTFQGDRKRYQHPWAARATPRWPLSATCCRAPTASSSSPRSSTRTSWPASPPRRRYPWSATSSRASTRWSRTTATPPTRSRASCARPTWVCCAPAPACSSRTSRPTS